MFSVVGCLLGRSPEFGLLTVAILPCLYIKICEPIFKLPTVIFICVFFFNYKFNKKLTLYYVVIAYYSCSLCHDIYQLFIFVCIRGHATLIIFIYVFVYLLYI